MDRLARRAPRTLAPRSARGRLARLAAEAAASSSGVIGLVGGDPLARTWDGEGWVDGVGCVAEPDGRYALSLHLAVALVAFDPLARAVRERIVVRADRSALGELVGPIRIVIEEIESAGPTDERAGDRR